MGERAARRTEAPELVCVYTGQIAVARGPTLFATILGSCVSVSLWDPELRAGGMNHFSLPDAPAGCRQPHRFGGPAVTELIERLLALGAQRHRLQARIFGGASVMEALRIGSFDSLGARNVDAALDVLASRGIPLATREVGGSRGRKVLFDNRTGEAQVTDLRGPR